MKHKLLILVLVLMFGVSPVLAQDGGNHTVAFDGFSFSYDSALAENVNIVPFAGDSLNVEQPGGPQAPYTEFVLYNGIPAPESSFDAAGSVRVYRIADMAGYTDHESRVAALQNLLAQRPDLAQQMIASDVVSDVTLPFLPVVPIAQVIRARAEYVDSGILSGIRFLTGYTHAAPEPYLHDSIFYTFQGISADGAYYVSVIIWLDATMFPAEVGADFDWDAFYADPLPYYNESIATLNAAAPEAFVPSLVSLDALVQSMSFGG